MGIGLSGMISGLDTDTLIKQLMSAERTRVTKVENKITKHEWLTEKWKGLNTKIYSMYTGSLAKMKTQGNYLTKKTSTSNDKVVKATAGATAPIGTHYVTVESVASAQYVTGGTFTAAEKLTSKSKLVDAGVAAGTRISVSCGDKSEELIVDENTTFANFSETCKAAGLNVNFDEVRQCLYISSRQSGTENKFSITTSKENTASAGARNSIYELAGYSTMTESEKTAFDNAMSVIEASDSASVRAVLAKAENGEELTAEEKKIEDAYQLLSDKTAENAAGKLAKSEIDAGISAQIKDAIQNKSAVTIYGKELTAEQATALQAEAERMAKVEYETDLFQSVYGEDELLKTKSYGELKQLKEKVADELTEEEQNILAAYEAKEADFLSELGTYTEGTGYSGAGYAAYYERSLQAFAEDETKEYNGSAEAVAAFDAKKAEILASNSADITTAKTELAGQIDIYADVNRFDEASDALNAIGLGNIDGSTVSAGSGAGGMTVFEANDARVTVNGAVIESSTNNISVNGLNLELVSAAPGETISVNVSQDTDRVYDMVKQFVKDYNEVLDALNTAYYAESARGYDPLTDEQKDAMSDTEVEKWETKIKDSLLRRDNTLGSLINSMRTALNGCVTVDGKDYALSSFGICTTKYSEKGKLHIYGDQEDSEGMLYDDKLRKAIEEDPETVMEVLQKISKDLYDTMADKMKATELSSALTFYNDKQLTKELTSYKKDLSKEEDRLTEIEDRYYKQFASMETALSKLSSQSSSLASMLGMGQY
ncbi:MAG: flagellar filament capping protein FliD [Lachnospiraceae bacterium]|nr:flagellar filament capping protein FliD [Lachnospiraceae bacterium]